MTARAVTHVLYLAEKPGRHSFGGAENHVWQLLPALVRTGCDVELLVLAWHPGPALGARCRELEAAGVRVTIVERPPFRGAVGKVLASVRCWARCFALLRRRRERVVHVHLDEIVTPVLARLAGCRAVVFTFHCDEPRYRRPLWRAWFVVAGRMVRRFVAITEHVRRYCVAQLRLPPAHVRVVYYGVEAAAGARDGVERTRLRRQLGVGDDDWVVGFVGRFVEQKNLPVLVEALARMPDATGVLVGGGPMEPALRALIARRGLANVRLVGPVPDGAALMPAFDVLCLPSRWEGLGLVLVEAMHARVPVVASRAGAIPEVLADGACGWLCEPDSVDDLVAALTRCRSDRAGTAARIAAAEIAARERFAVATMATATCAVYSEAMTDAAVTT